MVMAIQSVENITIFKPFIKRVGGKRQLLTQFQHFYPKKFKNYFEPFLGG
jgi:DNA adenine methylase